MKTNRLALGSPAAHCVVWTAFATIFLAHSLCEKGLAQAQPTRELRLGEGKPPEPPVELTLENGKPPEPPPEKPEPKIPPKKIVLPSEIALTDFLVISPVGKYQRAPLHVDFLESRLVDGSWKTPEPGETITSPSGEVRSWEKVSSGKDGWLENDALWGGYALASIDSPAERVMILEPRGHNTVFVNGQPRTGDPYNTGWLRLPVVLKKGTTQFLFHGARGRISAKLTTPSKPVVLDTRDATLPDLIGGESGPYWGSILLVNASRKTLRGLTLTATRPGHEVVRNSLASVPPLTTTKVAFRLEGNTPLRGGKVEVVLDLIQKDGQKEQRIDKAVIALEIRTKMQLQRRTFLSEIDGSVQTYALRPAVASLESAPKAGLIPKLDTSQPGLLLALHGYGGEADVYASMHKSKNWAHVVAPTNRRPYGFDWEDWGRTDAIEALDHAQSLLNSDPRRVYVYGDSMGGHGAWHLGATLPDRFAAISPIAAWPSFRTDGRIPKTDNSNPLLKLLGRSTNQSDTLTLQRNFLHQGVYILHAEHDQVVPVSQARFMRGQLAAFHPNFAYYEIPGSKYVMGSDARDSKLVMEFIRHQSIPPRNRIRKTELVTCNPGITSRSHWLTIEAQEKQLEPSRATVEFDPNERRFRGSTSNVARLALDVSHLDHHKPLKIELDGRKINDVRWPEKTKKLWLTHKDDRWRLTSQSNPKYKGPHRYGSFKDVFRHRAVLVYGTKGNAKENAWSQAKARFDAETFWYKGNGTFDVIADVDFKAGSYKDRNVVIYGNADTNAAWPALLSTSPIQMRRGIVRIGQRPETGDDVACLMIRPRPDSDKASVGVVSGTGLPGMRATNRLRYFVSGIAYPDLFLFGAGALKEGTSEIRALGNFGLDWTIESGEFEWRDLAL